MIYEKTMEDTKNNFWKLEQLRINKTIKKKKEKIERKINKQNSRNIDRKKDIKGKNNSNLIEEENQRNEKYKGRKLK